MIEVIEAIGRVAEVEKGARDTATENAEEVDRLITDHAGITMIHIHLVATTERESVKSATAATDVTIESGIEIEVQDGEMIGGTIDVVMTAISSMIEGAPVAEVETPLQTSVEREKTEMNSRLKQEARKLLLPLLRSANRLQT